MAAAVESEFGSVGSESDFPNDAVILFAEALAENGIDDFGDIEPAPVRFARDNLADPDYEIAG